MGWFSLLFKNNSKKIMWFGFRLRKIVMKSWTDFMSYPDKI